MNSTKIEFHNEQGEKLIGRLELPINQKPKAFALFAHCFTCNKNLNAVRNISRALTKNGYGIFRFDFTGLGESDGDFADTNFSSNIEDLVCAAEYLEKEFEGPKLIIGHSLGGAAAIFAASQLASIQAVATIGAPSDPGHVTHLFTDNIDEINTNNSAKVNLGGREFTIKKQFIDDISNNNMQSVVKGLDKSLLIMHSPQDNTVGVENAADIYGYAMHPKSFVSLDGADHLLSDKSDSIYVGDVIATWANRYIHLEDEEEAKTDHHVLAQIGPDSYTTEITAGVHRLIADEPESVGGNNFGPSPYGYLLSGLGACTAMTMKMYAARKNWDFETIDVHLSHTKDYAKDCDECESSSSKIDIITKEIEIVGDLTEEQLDKLMVIADKCPVHRTLQNEVKFSTRRI